MKKKGGVFLIVIILLIIVVLGGIVFFLVGGEDSSRVDDEKKFPKEDGNYKTGTVKIPVFDENDQSITNAAITVYYENGNVLTISDTRSGSLVLNDIPLGKYRAIVNVEGYETEDHQFVVGEGETYSNIYVKIDPGEPERNEPEDDEIEKPDSGETPDDETGPPGDEPGTDGEPEEDEEPADELPPLPTEPNNPTNTWTDFQSLVDYYKVFYSHNQFDEPDCSDGIVSEGICLHQNNDFENNDFSIEVRPDDPIIDLGNSGTVRIIIENKMNTPLNLKSVQLPGDEDNTLYLFSPTFNSEGNLCSQGSKAPCVEFIETPNLVGGRETVEWVVTRRYESQFRYDKNLVNVYERDGASSNFLSMIYSPILVESTSDSCPGGDKKSESIGGLCCEGVYYFGIDKCTQEEYIEDRAIDFVASTGYPSKSDFNGTVTELRTYLSGFNHYLYKGMFLRGGGINAQNPANKHYEVAVIDLIDVDFPEENIHRIINERVIEEYGLAERFSLEFTRVDFNGNFDGDNEAELLNLVESSGDFRMEDYDIIMIFGEFVSESCGRLGCLRYLDHNDRSYPIALMNTGDYGLIYHELFHAFGATDIYATTPARPTDKYVFAGCMFCSPQLPIEGAFISEYNRANMGWLDLNGNGVIDIFE